MKKTILKTALGIAGVALLGMQAVAMTGSDSATNYTSWVNGSIGGTGFQPWALYSNNHGADYAGYEVASSGTGDANINNGAVWKLYAVNFETNQQWEEAIAYRAFTTPLSAANDTFAVSMEMQDGNNGVGNPGQMGFALRNGDVTGSGNQTAGARLQVYLAGSPDGNSFAQGGTNYIAVVDASGTHPTTVTNVGVGSAFNFRVTLASANTYNLSITPYTGIGTTGTPVIVTGTLAGSGTIDSFSLFNWKNSTNSGCNSDAYFNHLSYSNGAAFTCPTITLRRLQNLQQGVAYSQSVVAIGGVAPYSYSVAGGALPAGLSLSSAGVLSGTPTALGASTFTIVATDANGCTGGRDYSLGVYASGADNSLNYTSGAWTNSANGGTGFAPWEFHYDNHGHGYAGLELAAAGDINIQDALGNVWKLYAVDFSSFNTWQEATAYRKFNNPLGGTGDGLSLSFGLQNGNNGVGDPGQIGFALRNGDCTGSSDRNDKARLQVYLDGSANNVVVEDASGAHVTSVPYDGPGATYDCAVTLTGPNTYSVSIAPYAGLGTNGTPVTVTGTLAGSGSIDSLAMFSWNYAASGYNSDAYFNSLAYTGTAPLITNNVTFQVDMSVQVYAGNFDPASDMVEVQGSFNGWNSGLILTNNPGAANSNIYRGVIPIVGAVGSGESYKFAYTNAITGAMVWESSTPKVSTPDTGYADYNRFFQLPATNAVLPAVLFDDKETNDYLPSDMTVTFSVDMNGAVTTEGTNFTEGSDTVWINGAFIPWYPWYDPANPVPGPATYEMTDMGGGIYSITLTIPKGTPVGLEYKYGVGIGSLYDLGPRDNEAPVDQNHFRVIRSTATGAYTLPQDTFGDQYHEPLFSPADRGDGQLTIGVPSGGTIPVRWLGRPGARLQSATNIAGPWTDHSETDGTNWTSGVNTTNGLMSVTNWPSSGTTYFRLVKP